VDCTWRELKKVVKPGTKMIVTYNYPMPGKSEVFTYEDELFFIGVSNTGLLCFENDRHEGVIIPEQSILYITCNLKDVKEMVLVSNNAGSLFRDGTK
jgi:hypothetical protein